MKSSCLLWKVESLCLENSWRIWLWSHFIYCASKTSIIVVEQEIRPFRGFLLTLVFFILSKFHFNTDSTFGGLTWSRSTWLRLADCSKNHLLLIAKLCLLPKLYVFRTHSLIIYRIKWGFLSLKGVSKTWLVAIFRLGYFKYLLIDFTNSRFKDFNFAAF